MKPPVPYFGSKRRTAPWIASLLPDHEHYVEPFAGGLSVLLTKIPSKLETVSDLDGRLMTFWRVLRDRPGELARVCALTPHSRAEHEAAYEDTPGDELETARRVWVRLTQGRGGTLRKTGWRQYVNPAGTTTSLPGCLDGYVDRLAAAAERLHAMSLEALPALELIDRYGRHPGVLLYVDPPYLDTTRGLRDRYGTEMRRADQHRELAAALDGCKAAVVLSGYPSPLYDDLYAGWRRRETTARADNASGDRSRTEVLWSNRPFAADLLDEFLTGSR